MARARTGQELLDFGEKEYGKLMELVNRFTPEQQITLQVFENRTIKDVLAHLHDWHELVFAWENEGKDGGKPIMPAKGYTWKDLPAFNEMLFQRSKDRRLGDVLSDFENSHKEAMKRIAGYPAGDLEAKAKFAWTGSTNIASYYASATSSHYVWAAGLLKKLWKNFQTSEV